MDIFPMLHLHYIYSIKSIHYIYRFITNSKSKAVIESLSSRRSPGHDGFLTEFYKAVKEDVTPKLWKIFRNIELNREKLCQKPSMRPALFWYQNQKHNTKKKIIDLFP